MIFGPARRDRPHLPLANHSTAHRAVISGTTEDVGWGVGEVVGGRLSRGGGNLGGPAAKGPRVCVRTKLTLHFIKLGHRTRRRRSLT